MLKLSFYIAFLTVISVISAGCDALTGTSNVMYEASGTATSVMLTYETEDGTEQITNARLPWSYARKAQDDEFLYLSAQIMSNSGTVTVVIRESGTVQKTATSSGLGATATASMIKGED